MSFVSANDINETQDDVLTIDEESIIDVNSGDFSSLSNYLYKDNYLRLNGDITRSPNNNDLMIQHNITIDGNGHTINANNLGRIFFILDKGELTLKNLKLINGYANDGPGGAILNYHGKLTITDCTFDNNHAVHQGGAISCDAANTVITGTNVFSNNRADIDAGAIYNYCSELTMSGKNTFESNSALVHGESKGGAILNVFGGAKMTITGETIFNNNQAIYDGGAIFNHQATLSMDGTNTFTNNKLTGSQGKGGAINNENATFTLSGVNIFKSNSAVRGAAIDNNLFDSVFTISGKNQFINNKASRMGGAIANHFAKRLNLYGENIFETNNAGEIGGAIYSYDSILNMNSNNIFARNTASKAGGAIYSSLTSLTIDGNNMFSGNNAPEGGAILLIDSTRVDILGENVFDSNTATSTGGAIRANNVKELILNNHNYFSNNRATHSGGAIYMQNSVLNTQGGLYESNSAQYGGAIFLEKTAFAGNYNIFKNNYASKTGSDIESYQSSINSLEFNYWNSQNKVSQNNIHNYAVSNINNWVVIDFTIPSEIKQNTNTEVLRFKNNNFGNLAGEMPIYGVQVTPNFNPQNVVITKNVGTSQYTGPLGQTAVSASSSNFGASKTVNVVEGKLKTSLNGNNIVLKEPVSSVNYEVTLTDANGKALSGKTVTITVNGAKNTKTTNGQGKASLTLTNLENGYYDIVSSYDGETNYYASSVTNCAICMFNNESNTNIVGKDFEMYYKDGSRYAVTVTGADNKPIASKDVKFIINGVVYTRQTDSEGKASIALNLDAGKLNITAVYPGDDKNEFAFTENTVTIKSTIEGNDIVKYFRNGTQYYAKFLDSKGNPLKNTDIKYNINGVLYTRTTDGDGSARMNINLNPGVYIITAMHPNGESHGNKITVLSILEGNDLTKYYRNDSQYYIKVLSDDGSPAKQGEIVKFNINGVFYERVVNENGSARMNINLNPGDYIITAEYKGLQYSNKIKVLPVLTGEDISMRYKDGTSYKAKLVDGQGKAIANHNVTFNINGVFYNRTTNSDGYASLNINLMPGEYIITAEHETARTSNRITIRP